MITKEKFPKVLERLRFIKLKDIYTKPFKEFDCTLKVDLKNEKLIYPDEIKVNSKEVCSFSKPEFFVQFECVNRLLNQGYNPKHIELV